jgi:hypothetical protein
MIHLSRRKIILKEGNAKRCHLKKLTCKKWTLRQVSEVPSSLRICLGWSSNFVGSESGQIQSVKLLQNGYGLQQNPIPPFLPYTLYAYIQYTYTHSGGGELNQREGESTVPKAGLYIPTRLNVRKKLAISSL